MSAFIVEDKTINAIITSLSSCKNSYLINELQEIDNNYSLDSQVSKDLLAQAMLDLNIEAVNARYREQTKGTVTFYSPESRSLVGYYKALQCWLYQCSEGDVPEKPLFKLFENVFKPHLASEIIYKLPEYDRTLWG